LARASANQRSNVATLIPTSRDTKSIAELSVGNSLATIRSYLGGNFSAPQPEAAVGRHIQAGGLFGDQGGLTLGKDQHTGRKSEMLRATGQKTEQHKRIVVGVLAGPYPAFASGGGRIGTQNVVRGLQIVKAQTFDGLSVVADLAWAGANIGDGNGCA
jgi:hypothetical protein